MKKINMFLKNKKNYGLFLVFELALLSFVAASDTSAATHTLTLTSSGSQSINVSASSGTAISSDSINVATTCRYGYNFTLSTSVSNNNLYLNGDISNNASGTYFSPVDGSTALNAATNKWGYYYNSNASNTPTSTSVFSPVPTLSSPATIKTPLTTPASSNINDNFKIYYGVNSAPSMSIGTYKMIPDTNNSNNDGTLVYTATVADTCMRYTVHFSPTSIFEGNTLSGTGTMSDQTIYEGVATPLTTNGFTAPSGYYFIGWNTAQDGSGTSYTDGQSVTDLTAAGNTITLYAQWNDCPNENICYFPNVTNPTDIEGEMGHQPILGTDTSIDLWAPNYKRSGYGFIAWNTKKDGTGTNYGPNQTLELTAGQYTNNRLKLYAKWVASTGNMQGWTGCSSMSIGDVTALKDTRDNDVYAVAKLADGKCWMIENLRLDDSATLSTSNTHNPSLPLTNTDGSTSNHLSPTTNPIQTAWCQESTASCYDKSMLATNNTTLFVNNNASNYSASDNVYSYGNYYNWYSATAGNGRYSTSPNNTSVTGDICPVGWHLPKGGDSDNIANSEFAQLDIALGGTGRGSYSNTTPTGSVMSMRYRVYPNNIVYSGGMGGQTILGRNAVGYLKSPTAYSNAYNSYSLAVYNSQDNSVAPGSVVHNKSAGHPVRCVFGN